MNLLSLAVLLMTANTINAKSNKPPKSVGKEKTNGRAA